MTKNKMITGSNNVRAQSHRMSLRLVTRHMLQVCQTEEEKDVFKADDLIRGLNVERRRVYDVAPVFEACGLFKRLPGYKGYYWLGWKGFNTVLDSLSLYTSATLKHELKRSSTVSFQDYARVALFLLHVKHPHNIVWTAQSLSKAIANIEQGETKRRMYNLVNVFLSMGIISFVKGSDQKVLQPFQWTPPFSSPPPVIASLPKWLRLSDDDDDSSEE